MLQQLQLQATAGFPCQGSFIAFSASPVWAVELPDFGAILCQQVIVANATQQLLER